MKLAGVELPVHVADAFTSCRRHFVAAFVFSFFLNLLFLAPAIYMIQVYDRVVSTGGKATLAFVTLALAVALVTLAALDVIRSRLLVRASAQLEAALAPVILKRMMSTGGQEGAQALRDFDTVRQTIASPVTGALMDAPWAPIFIVVAFLLHFWIGITALVSVLLLLAIAWKSQQVTRENVGAAGRELGHAAMSGQAASLHGDIVRALGMTSVMCARQLAERSSGMTKLVQSQFAGSRFAALSRFVRLFVQSAALGVGALLAIAGEFSGGAIIAGSILVGRALQPVDGVVGGLASLNSARAALERLAETLRRPCESDRIRTALPKPEGRLELENVDVRGPCGSAILSGLSISVRPGEILGIIGPSGSGKTTLAKVIAGAVLPEAGTVRIDGAQRSDWDPDVLGRFIGYVPQESTLFSGTIKENVSRFASWAPENDNLDIDAEVVAAAKLVGVHELILRLPQGYDTSLGPLGSGLSAGQAQRIALARAFYGRPNLLVLDEPNAFLDADGETALVRAIAEERSRGATVLVIAHRRAVLEAANRLLVLEDGRPRMLGPARDVVARLATTPYESAA